MDDSPTGARRERLRLLLMVCCLWQAACAQGPRPVGTPLASAGAGCESDAPGAEYAHALLRIGCDGTLLPGRAAWSVEEAVVTLEFPPGTEGPVGAELVRTWPPADEPPWLGHRVLSVTVISRGGIEVRFAAPPDDPARLFADPRLSGVAPPVAVEGDARDAIDEGGTEVVTHHAASIEYARSLGREVRPAGFDRLYLVVFAGGGDAPQSGSSLAAGMVGDWVGWGAPGERRPPVRDWDRLTDRCGSRGRGLRGGAVPAGDDAATRAALALGRPTVAYEDGDLPGRQAAERLVSAGMRGGVEGEAVASLTGTRGRLSVRGAEDAPPSRAPSDVAAVLRVHAGPGHPCSLHAEVLRAAAAWGAAEDSGGPPRIVLLGELAAFAVARPPGVRP